MLIISKFNNGKLIELISLSHNIKGSATLMKNLDKDSCENVNENHYIYYLKHLFGSKY